MNSLIGYIFLGAGVIAFLVSLFDNSRRSMPLKFVAIMLVMGGLAILQYTGTVAPNPYESP